jgi:hypothetical protein
VAFRGYHEKGAGVAQIIQMPRLLKDLLTVFSFSQVIVTDDNIEAFLRKVLKGLFTGSGSFDPGRTKTGQHPLEGDTHLFKVVYY